MKRSFVIILLGLTSCAPYMAHSPDLVSKPADEAKYSDDLNACRHETFGKRGIDVGQSAAIGGFGLLGMAAYGKPPAYEQVDECLRKKGYKIAS